MDAAGNIFGVSLTTAFELSRNGSAGWNSTVIYTFEDGAYPNGTLLLDKTGNLYGTTYHGGAFNFGTVYKLSYSKKKGWTEKILYSFKGSPEDGMAPMGIVFDAAGNIFGNTGVGGKYESGRMERIRYCVRGDSVGCSSACGLALPRPSPVWVIQFT